MANPTDQFKYLRANAKSLSDKILVAILENQGSITVDTGDIVVNTGDIEQLLKGIGGSTETFTPTVNTNTSGTVTAGAFSVAFENSGTINVTVAGAILKPGKVWEAEAKTGNTLGAIAWSSVGAGGELTILETR